jgi:hypothetical protein
MFELWRRILQQVMLKIELVVIAAIYGLSWIIAGLAIYNVYE